VEGARQLAMVMGLTLVQLLLDREFDPGECLVGNDRCRAAPKRNWLAGSDPLQT